MELPPLTDGRILDRYKRFFADVDVPKLGVVTAHCPNTGSMKTCWRPNAPAQISKSDNPKRKLKWTLERVDMGSGWIGVNTARVNAVIADGVRAGTIDALAGYRTLKREPACDVANFPKSRFDFRLCDGVKPSAWVEVKNVTLLQDGMVRFPDAVTTRGRKHLELLSSLAQAGERAVLIFAINRPEGKAFEPAADIDPAYARSLQSALASGVEVLLVRLRHGLNSIDVADATPYA